MLSQTFEVLDGFKPSQRVQFCQKEDQLIICQICLLSQSILNCYSVGCQHLFCKNCLISHTKQQISNYQLITCCQVECSHIIDYSQNSVYHVLQLKTQKLVDSILNNYKRITALHQCSSCKKDVLIQSIYQSKTVLVCNTCKTLFCYNCFKPIHSQLIACTSFQKVQLPEDCQQCRKCHSIIQKKLGCSHIKCICGYEFCFECGFHWESTHICQHKLAKRTGLSKYCCIITKIFMAPPLLILIGLFVLSAVLAICMMSSMISGVVFWSNVASKYLFKNKKTKQIGIENSQVALRQVQQQNSNSFCDCVLFMVWIMMLPICFLVIGAFGFFAPLINVCHDKEFYLNPNIIKELFSQVEGWIYLYTII